MAILRGFEPRTFAVTGQRSSQLSYKTINIVWAPPLIGNDKSANHIIVQVIRTTPTILRRISYFFKRKYAKRYGRFSWTVQPPFVWSAGETPRF